MRLQQILLNLAGNAVKFTDQGEVEMRLEGQSQDGGACLTFVVRDTGIGIPAAGLQRLFQPFSQLDASMARRFGGTGLGLSISKSLVEMMGGRLWAESEVGRGSTFYFALQLPLADKLPPEQETPACLAGAPSSRLRILLAEDNPANQKLVAYALKERGHCVEIAANGLEAVELSSRGGYDVILMDVQMPEMNGLDAARVVRARENGNQHVPIIALTAHAMRGDRERCLAAGMDAYLSKPIASREMIGLVESLAGKAGSPSVPAIESPAGPQAAFSVFMMRRGACSLRWPRHSSEAIWRQ
jgi:CheY-like chemotaxis protein